jgi:hypothetical protein
MKTRELLLAAHEEGEHELDDVPGCPECSSAPVCDVDGCADCPPEFAAECQKVTS